MIKSKLYFVFIIYFLPFGLYDQVINRLLLVYKLIELRLDNGIEINILFASLQ